MTSEEKMATSIWGTLMFSSTGDIGRQMKINHLCDPGRRYDYDYDVIWVEA